MARQNNMQRDYSRGDQLFTVSSGFRAASKEKGAPLLS
jgi:hypothetical protein